MAHHRTGRKVLVITRKKKAISEVIATVVLIAVTIVIGAGAWVCANSASGNSQHNLGQAAQGDIHSVSERFQIISVNFTYASGATSTSTVVIWIYNSGIYDTNVSSILLNNTSYSGGQLSSRLLPKQQLTAISITTLSPQVHKGDLQMIKVVGQYGSYFTYQSVA